jgi:nucleoid-associated protein YgaU
MGQFIAQHTVRDTDTLSGLALKYYGSTSKDKWMLIYDANKDVIGANPDVLRPGIVLNIPDQNAPGAQGQGPRAPQKME